MTKWGVLAVLAAAQFLMVLDLAQLKAPKAAFLFAAFPVVASLWTTRRLPTQRFEEQHTDANPPLAEPATA